MCIDINLANIVIEPMDHADEIQKVKKIKWDRLTTEHVMNYAQKNRI